MPPQTIPIVQPLSASMEPFVASASATTANAYFQGLGSTLLQSMQYVAPYDSNARMPSVTVSAFVATDHLHNNELDAGDNFLLHSTSSSSSSSAVYMPTVLTATANLSAVNELQKQLEYDKFMNEIWIGIVLLLIFISMIFCVCSCLLYHQFRTWKRNYHRTLSQPHDGDVEAFKVNPADMDDPLPEYTLVSGLPTYEAALELLKCKSINNNNRKTTTSTTLIHDNHNNNNGNNNNSGYLMHVQPASIFEIFHGNNHNNINDITTSTVNLNNNNHNNNNNQDIVQQQSLSTTSSLNYVGDEQQDEINAVVTTPLLLTTTVATTTAPAGAAIMRDTNTLGILTAVNEKSKSNTTTTIIKHSKSLEKLHDNNNNNNNNNNKC